MLGAPAMHSWGKGEISSFLSQHTKLKSLAEIIHVFHLSDFISEVMATATPVCSTTKPVDPSDPYDPEWVVMAEK